MTQTMADRHASTCLDSGRRTWALALLAPLCALMALLGPAPARADIFGPDESIAGAVGPLQPGITYSGAFSSPDDVDYLSFDVTHAGETLHFDVVNTLTGCNSLDEDYCPMWGTLADGNGQQLGGEGSFAGTGEVDYASSDTIDYTFAAPGRYYLVLESSGDLPTFNIDFYDVPYGDIGAGGSGGSAGNGHGHGATPGATSGGSTAGGTNGGGSSGGGSTAAAVAKVILAAVSTVRPGTLITSMTVVRRQRGSRPSAVIVLRQPLAWLDAGILAPIGPHHRLKVVGALRRLRPIAGPERVRVTVPSGTWLKRHPRGIGVVYRVVAHSPSGRTEVAQRKFTLRR